MNHPVDSVEHFTLKLRSSVMYLPNKGPRNHMCSNKIAYTSLLGKQAILGQWVS